MSSNHSHNLYFLPSGSIEEFNVVIEIPYGSQNKYELDAKTGALFLDRVLYGSVFYPFNYGFIPSTKADDGDAFDVGVFLTNPVPPATVVRCRAIGLINKIDSDESDPVALAVPIDDPRFHDIQDIADLPQHLIKDIVDFFENMQKFKKGDWKKNVNKVVSILSKAEADQEIAKYLNNYPEYKE